MKKKKIFAGNYDVVLQNFGYAFIAALFLVGGILVKVKYTPEPLIEPLVNFISNAVVFSSATVILISLYFALRATQFAYMDEKGIKFKSIFGSLGFISWSDIKSADKSPIKIYKQVCTKNRYGAGNAYHFKPALEDFYLIISTDYHNNPKLQLNPKRGGIARTIPYPDSRFEEQLYFYRPDLKPAPPIDENQ